MHCRKLVAITLCRPKSENTSCSLILYRKHRRRSRTWCGLSANLECRSETCCARLAEKYRTQKIAKKSPSGHHRDHPTTLSGYIFATKHVSTIGKKLLSSNISSTSPHNMVNFGPLAAEIVSLVWGTPANFNGFHVLAGLLHGTLAVGVSQTLRR